MKIKVLLIVLLLSFSAFTQWSGAIGGFGSSGGNDAGALTAELLTGCRIPLIIRDTLIGKVASAISDTVKADPTVDSITLLSGSLPQGTSYNKTTRVISGLVAAVYSIDSVCFKSWSSCGNDSNWRVYQFTWDTLNLTGIKSIPTDTDTVYNRDSCQIRGSMPSIRLGRTMTGALNGITVTFYPQTDSLIGFTAPDSLSAGACTLAVSDSISDGVFTYDTLFFTCAGFYDTTHFTLQPRDTTVQVGQNARFSTRVTGTGTPTFKWQFKRSGVWYDTAVNNDTLIFEPSLANNGDSVRCIVTEVRGADTSTAVKLTVNNIIRYLTVSSNDSGSTDRNIGGPWAVADDDSLLVVLIPNLHNSIKSIVFTGGASLGDSGSGAVYVKMSGADGSATFNFGPDTFGLAYTITGGNAAVTFLDDSIAAYNESITCTLTVSTGYTADWPGGHVGPGKSVLTVLMTKDSTLAVTTYGIPLVDSIRPGPKANRNDSCTASGIRFSSAGVLRNATAGVNAVQKYWSDTQIDFYTDMTWPRGWNTLIFTTKDSLRDTGAVYITIPRKTN